MFQTVRHWWTGGRGKVTARLFLFELIVVILGVLIAQGLANWVAERGERAEGERLAATAETLARDYQADLNYWSVYGPCLRRHLQRIGRAAATGGTMSAEEIGRPALPLPDEAEFTANDWRKMRMAIPDERAAALIAVIGSIKTYEQFIADTARQWATLRLLDPSVGPPSLPDRSQVRLATAIIDNNVRWMMFQHATQSVGNFTGAGIEPSKSLPNSSRLVDRCGMLRDWR